LTAIAQYYDTWFYEHSPFVTLFVSIAKLTDKKRQHL